MFPIITVLTDASETKTFTSNFDLVFAEGGDDAINGAGGDDTLLGNDGQDTLNGGSDNDKLYGEDDWDTLDGGTGNDMLYGGTGWDTLSGGAGLDTLWGGDDIYADTVSYDKAASAAIVDLAAGEGYTVGLGKAADLDTLHEIGSIEGSKFADTLKGDGEFNTIWGGGAGDQIYGRGGADQLWGEKGADQLYGEGGDDEFVFIAGDVAAGETIDGGTGIDALAVSGGGTIDFRGASLVSIEAVNGIASSPVSGFHFYGEQFGSGHIAANAKFSEAIASATMRVDMHLASALDLSGLSFTDWNAYLTVTGDTTAETITGTSRGETIYGKGGADVIKAGGGDDTVAGGGGDDIMLGGTGIHDTVSYADSAAGVKVNLGLYNKQDTGGGGFDTIASFEWLAGSEFADELTGNSGSNRIFGNGGDDMMTGGAGADSLNGGNGFDTANYAASAAAVTVDLGDGTASGGDAAGDTLSGMDNVIGSKFADTMHGGFFDNVFEGGGGADMMNGHNGFDTASYALSTAVVTAALDMSVAGTNDALGDSFVEMENITGTNVAGSGDTLRGDAGNNTVSGLGGGDLLYGRDGHDTVLGGDGDDNLVGGLGLDMLTGGAGKDIFRMTALTDAGDDIYDFDGAFDFVSFKASAFGGGLVAGQALKASQFVANAAPVASGLGGQFLYETDTGALSWDANGSAAGGVTLLATLTGAPVLVLDDFQIV